MDSLREKIFILKSSLPSGTEYYEYKTVLVSDNEDTGAVNSEKIELTLCKLALEGWRLKTAITNEVGHNVGVMTNSTVNNTILIFERLTAIE